MLDLPNIEKYFYTDAIPLIMCLLFVFACYTRSRMIISGYPIELQENMKKSIKKLLLYPLLQIIALAPAMTFVVLNVLIDLPLPMGLIFLVGIPVGLVGLANAIIFFIQQRSSQNLQESGAVLEEINSSLGSDESFITVDSKFMN